MNWISVKDKLPEESKAVFLNLSTGIFHHCIVGWLIKFTGNIGFFNEEYQENKLVWQTLAKCDGFPNDPEYIQLPIDFVAHWLELPKAPNTNKEIETGIDNKKESISELG